MSELQVAQERKIVTSIPGPISQKLHAKRLQEVSHGVGALLPIYIDRAHGAILVDVDGNQFIDLGSGIGVTTIGHTNDEVVKAVQEQVAKLTHTLFTLTPYVPYVQVCEIINRHAPGQFEKRSALFNSGSEAVENAVKIARKYTGRGEIAVFDHGYHGRTNLTMAMNFKAMPYASGMGPFAPGVTHVPMSYPFRDGGISGEDAAKRAITYMEKRIGGSNLAAIVIEPIQGEGGFMVPAPGFLQALDKWAKENGIVMVADEVQSGIARTGRFFASHWEEGFEPDLITFAKGIAGGMPISGVVGRAEIMDSVHAGGLGGTFGGNPVSCAASIAVFSEIEKDNLLEEAKRVERVLGGGLRKLQEKHPEIGEVRGKGAMLAIELVHPGTKDPYPEAVTSMVAYGAQHGLLLLSAGTYGNVLRFLPSVKTSDALLEDALTVLDEALSAL